MLILVTGVPGSGKSLFTVDLIEKYLLENKKLIESGQQPRAIFSDIDGLNIEGVERSPDDWRDCPDGSIVVYDECQQRFGPDGQGRSSREDIQEFETHRHRGFDIILITQHPKLLHAHVRRLVGRHYHVYRMHGTQNAKIFQKDGQIDIDKVSQLNAQDSYMWSYPKQHFAKYKSATLHTHKAHLPKWMKRGFIGLVVVSIIMAFLAPKAFGFLSGQAVEDVIMPSSHLEQTKVTQAETMQTIEVKSDVVSPVACITMGDSCACYGKSGHKLDIPFQFCKRFTEDTPRYIDFSEQPS